MAKAVGIDLGTTNSVISVMEGGKPTVIQNAEGNRTTPSVVAFSKDGQRLVGQVARRQAIINPTKTIFSIKRFMGRKYQEVEEEMKIVPYEVVAGPNDAVRVKIDDKLFAPEEISAMTLRKLVDDASRFLGEEIKDVIITCPAYFNDAQRQATKDAGKIAGLNVLRIINEPTAASLAYGLDKKSNETILVYDLGGGTFDVSVLEVGEGVFEVKSTNGDTHLGGDNFDKRVVDYIADEFKKESGIDLRGDRQSLQRLYEAAEKAKCELSSVLETEINLPFITADASGPKHLQQKITRAKFEEITRDLVERTLGPMKQAIKDAKLSVKDIDEVVLVGGSTRIPAVQKIVKDFIGKDPNQSVNPDEVVAIGAGIQAGVLAGEVKDVLLLDVTPLSLGLETEGGLMTRLIDRNTTIPARRSQVFSTAEDNQNAVDIRVLQGERELARDNRELGKFRLEGIRPAPRGAPKIEVTFDIDANGILSVSAKDQDTGKQQSITISGSTNLDKGEIDRMVQDAEQHRDDDKRVRDEVEARNKAEQFAYQVERDMSEMGDKAPAAEKAKATEIIEKIRGLVKANASKTEIEAATRDLGEVYKKVAEAAYKAGAAQPNPDQGGPDDAGPGAGAGAPADDDVIDADYKEAK